MEHNYTRMNLDRLANLEGVAIVRYTAENQILCCVGAATRMRIDEKTDGLRMLTPLDLWEGMQEGRMVEPTLHRITQNRFQKAAVEFWDVPEYTSIFEAQSLGGSWRALRFGRHGSKFYDTTTRGLEDGTWKLYEGHKAEFFSEQFPFAPNAVEFAESYITAWELMVTTGVMIGRIASESVPPCAASGSQVISEMAYHEAEMRDMLRRRRIMSYRTNPQALSAIAAAIANQKAQVAAQP